MTIREQMEQREKEYLSAYATLSVNTRGRKREEAQCDNTYLVDEHGNKRKLRRKKPYNGLRRGR